MQCSRCGKDYPSQYHFKASNVCNECWEKLSPEAQADARRALSHMRTSTTFDIVGHRITRSFGVVRGITVRSRSIFGTIGGSLQTLVGGNVTLFTELCEKTREEAFEMMMRHAALSSLTRSCAARVAIGAQCTTIPMGSRSLSA